jgi:pimeloyl-ACP methyl ester carboxylesterase
MMLVHWPIVLSLLAYADVTVAPARSDRANTSFYRDLAALDRPTERTNETLRRYDLESRYRRDTSGAIGSLEGEARRAPDSELVYALAELSWLEAKRLDHRRRGEALDRYVDAVAYAYEFLFAPELADGRQPSDPRFQLARSLYNGGLDHLLRAALANPKSGRLEPDGKFICKVHGREQVFRIFLDQSKSPWKRDDVDQLILCSDYEVGGLPSKTYQHGVGVPLIAIRKSDRSAPGAEKFHPSEMGFPLTAFLRPVSKLRDAPVDDPRECALELVDPVRQAKVGVNPELPVESDLTTPLAYMWSKTDLSKYRWSGLLRPEQNMDRAGLMLIRPYEPGKIPVVMVHGLASTPLAWIPMLNELLGNPHIQEKYQFMLYLYPTGVPFPIAAAGLRETLLEAENTFNPTRSDRAFGDMILLGHSMGGLLAHAMVVESGNGFWQLYTDRTFDQRLQGPPKVLDELKRYMFFSPLPFVREVVFLGTPHRGSDLSRGFVGRVSAGLINDPDHVADLLSQVVRQNPGAFDRRHFRRLPTSVETLETNGEMLLALLAMKPGPNVAFHSIIGSLRPVPLKNTSDGVVPYSSSHFEGAASEVVVRSDHGVQANPLAILEVRRILLEHVGISAPSLPASTARAGTN